ncbi:MFS transporter [Promicromonospora vindobonensis]|uniref:MFS transporter n=1 Tax=Promicromonospora vindobonensis TaxID=195748 RepID=A0ABW5VXW9_9MICO
MAQPSVESQAHSQATARIVRRVTRRLLPILLLMYILAFLDRSNLGFAKDAFQADTGISEAAYALGAGIFFLGYAVFEVPSNLIMRRVGAKAWLARIMISWGIVSALMMFAHNEATFYVLRVLLGITEAGFFPGVILYLTYWIPVQHRARVNGYFYFGAPLAFILGGPMSGLLLDLDGFGGLHGWQLMFLVTGALTVLIGFVVIAFLDDGPADARWLSDEDRASLVAALESEDRDKSEHSPRGALRALTSPVVLFFCLIYCTIQASVYGVSFYLPTQVSALVGQDVGLRVGLLTAIPWVAAVVATFLLTRLADRTGRRREIAAAALAAAGVGMGASVLFESPVLALAGLSIGAAGFISVQPIFWTLPTSFLIGAAAASGIALINAVGSLGGFIAPVLKTAVDERLGDGAGMLVLGGIALLGSVLILLAKRLSRGAVEIAERTAAH